MGPGCRRVVVDPVPCSGPYSYTGELGVFYCGQPPKECQPWLAGSVCINGTMPLFCSFGWLCLLALPAAAQPCALPCGNAAAVACSPAGCILCWGLHRFYCTSCRTGIEPELTCSFYPHFLNGIRPVGHFEWGPSLVFWLYPVGDLAPLPFRCCYGCSMIRKPCAVFHS